MARVIQRVLDKQLVLAAGGGSLLVDCSRERRLAFGAGEAIYELIPPRNDRIDTMGNIMFAPTAATMRTAETQNAALCFGALGICLGGCLGVAGGLARRSTAATLLAGALGAILGGAAGAGISLALIPIVFKLQPAQFDYELIGSVLMHGAIWGTTGAVAGLAFAVGLGRPRTLVVRWQPVSGGPVLGTIAFDLIGAAVFPLASTAEPISTTWPSRLLARMLVAVGTAAIIMVSLSALCREPAEAPPAG